MKTLAEQEIDAMAELALKLRAQNARYRELLGECGEALMDAHPEIDGLSDRQRVGVLICKLQKEGVV